MQLSKRTQYGIRALVCFADAYAHGYLQARDLSAREKLPPKFLESILRTLTQNKLLTSKIGASGGYRLAKPPTEISLGAIVSILEGRGLMNDQDAQRHNERPGVVAIRITQARLTEAVRSVLDKTSLADLAEQVTQHGRGGQMYFI